MQRPKEITSAANSTYKELLSILSTKGIQKQNLALVSGKKFVAEIIQDHFDHVEGWITCDESPPPVEIKQWFLLKKNLFNDLDLYGTGAPLLIVKIPTLENYIAEQPWPIGCSLFVPFQNPDNCGAVIRSAAAFGVSRIILLQEAAHPFHPKSIRAAGPAVFKTKLMQGPSISDVSFSETTFFSLSAEGTPLPKMKFPETFGLITGVEGPGLPASLRSQAISIPMRPGVESLNAATATAIALYEWSKLNLDP